MGANISTNISNSVQNVQNDVMQESTQTCMATCSDISKGETVKIINSQTGNLDFSQKCIVSADCIMGQALNSSISDILTSLSKQKIDVDQPMLPNLEVNANTNTATVTQNTQNVLSQILSANCHSTSENISEGQLIYVENSKTGDIKSTQSGTATSQCAMNNMAKSVLLNKVMSENDQTTVSKSVLGMIMGVIILCVVIGGVGFLFTKMSGKKK